MATPRRHGHRWSRAPTPLGEGAPATAVRSLGGGLTPAMQEGGPPQAVPVRQIDAFLEALPRESISFLSPRSGEVRYNHALLPGQTLSIATFAIPDQYIWVINDVEFYAFGPAVGLQGAPITINNAGLVGLMKLELLFSGASPVQSQAQRMSPYTSPSQATTGTSGWPWLERNFGSSRMPSYALYAKEGQTIEARLTVEVLPRFPITKVGVNLHGFSTPAAMFSQIWLKGA